MSKKSRLHAIMTILRVQAAADERGATAIEYALIAAGVGVAVAATVYTLGSSTRALFQSVAAMFP
ncbi:MAG: Flp family type IVb pilin [Xanthobacteraceae bacterium]